MSEKTTLLWMKFQGDMPERNEFLRWVRHAVMELTSEVMTLDALIQEIAKNIFDHAEGKGSLRIVLKDGSCEFEIKDEGQEAHDLRACMGHSRLAGNGINRGVGLEMIADMALAFGIDLRVDASKGFCYSGIYTLEKFREQSRA
jgi:anti-sigma regulatory factor (Ser/Thr protein kinase)